MNDQDTQLVMSGTETISVVVPVFNEVDNLDGLINELLPCLAALNRSWEVIFVDDGSTDGSATKLDTLAAVHPEVCVIHFRRNFGQTAAMMAGFDYSRGDVIIPMDGDMQNDPSDISLLLDKLAEGYDVVSGWRKDRQDKVATRKLPSRMANWLISHVSGVYLNDYGCTLKAYRREILQGFRLYGEMHRFVPIFANWQGAKITEIPVKHRARVFGSSKYGLNRIFKVIFDLLLVRFLTHFGSKPIYIFGAVATFLFFMAGAAGLYATYLKFFAATPFIATPLPLVVTMGFIGGLTCTLMGLMAEVLTRIYFESQGKASYVVSKILNLKKDL